jgi:CubicO group peptidase (beta-lactamase class C family)
MFRPTIAVISSLAVALALTTQVSAAPAGQSDQAARIDAYMRSRLPLLRTPGLSMVVVDHGEVVLSRGYGFADRETSRPMTEDTPVLVASTNKGITALAMMQLVEQGLVDLDGPVVRYLPEFSVADERVVDITVRQILSHTSGVPGSLNINVVDDEHALERLVGALANVGLHREPGSGYEYSNEAYSVAGLIVQTVSGMSYEDYIATHIFAPLEMPRSTYDPSAATEWGAATTYAKSRGVVDARPMPIWPGYRPAGGLFTTANDVGRYFVALLHGGELDSAQVISQASLDEMWTPVPASGEESYGLGWSELHLAGLRVLSHAGDIAGGPVPGEFGSSGSQFLLVPDRGIAIGVLTNTATFDKAEVAQDVLAILLGQPPADRPARPDWRQSTFVPDRKAWDAFVGDYVTADGVLRVYREGDRLLASGAGISLEFIAQADSVFVMLSDLGALDEELVEFRSQPDRSVALYFKGRVIGVKQPAAN